MGGIILLATEILAPSFRLQSANGEPAPAGLVQSLLAIGRPLDVHSGQLLLEAGSDSDDVYVILNGTLRVTLFSADGREVIMRDLRGGSLFGDLSAMDGGKRSAGIVAVEDSALMVLSGRDFREQILATAEAAGWFASHLVCQVRQLTERLFELSTLNVRSRLHCQLLRMCALAGVADGAAIIDPAPTHEVLATMIGTHREAVTRELSYLASAGIIEQSRRKIHVRDIGRLTDLVRNAMGDVS